MGRFMSGETDLDKLLRGLKPKLLDGEYVFCSIPGARYGDYPELQPIAAISETEGLTLVIPRFAADQNDFAYESVFKGITLMVHSSLDAIGLTAAVSGILFELGISANVIAGYYHDQLFVPSNDADRALEALASTVLNTIGIS